MRIISASIDLSKIDKSKIIPGKQGAKYYNLDIIVSDEKNKYGQDTSISDKQSKEEREAKAKRNYLGNGKTVWEGTRKTKIQDTGVPASDSFSKPDDDLPF